MSTSRSVAVAIITVVALAAPEMSARAQQSPSQSQERALPPITLDLRDAPIREALQQVFNTVKADYSIDNAVAGYVTLKITDQPFENALKLIMRSASIPLTYTKESGVYIVKPRPLDTYAAPPPVPAPADTAQTNKQYQPYEQIQLTYIDSYDLAQSLGIIFVQNFVRQSQSGGSGGGLGGGGGGFGGGGLGGFGGGGGGLGGGGGFGGGSSFGGGYGGGGGGGFGGGSSFGGGGGGFGGGYGGGGRGF